MEATDRWQQVEDLFHAALERAPGERAAFLDQACGSDAELRAEVESIIAAHEAPGDFIDTPAYKITNSLFPSSIIESREGRVVGRYNIVGQIGRGGMGEVYMAEDSHLGRKVALKFLPARVTDDQSRLLRFEQEARAASALNHPNIVTIYEIGKTDGSHYIATELIEGDTLRRRLSRGQIELRDAIDITIQLASALAAAHQSGIVHRDIKPENIMLRPDGYVKILDFGLAKLTQQVESSSEEMAKRIVRVDTEPGVVMGTLNYMSPEQARGRDVDGRSDIFSLGVVLYEMIAKRAPFEGDTPSDVIASILKVEPGPLSKYSSEMPAELQRIVSLALHKDKSKRYQSADQMLLDLKNLKQDMEFEAKLSRTGGFMSSFLIKSTRRGLTTYMVLSGLAIVLVIGAAVWWLLSRGSTVQEIFLTSSLKLVPIADWKSTPLERDVSGLISPDGKFIAFSSVRGGSPNIWVKQINGGDPIQVTKGEWSDITPIWSPDGETIAFASNRGGQQGIWSVPALGGSNPKLIKGLDLSTNPNLRLWSKDRNSIYYEAVFNLFSLNLNTGEINQITNFDSSGPRPFDFSISRNENRAVYVQTREGQSDIWMLNLEDGSTVRITNDSEEERHPVWLPDGKRIIYSSNRGAIFQICMVFVDGGSPIQITSGESDSWIQDVSSDSTKILYTSTNEEGDLWEVDVNKSEEREFTSDAGVELWPDISPDGSMIAYQAVRDPSDGRRLYEGSVVVRQLGAAHERVEQIANGFDPRWSTDGKKLTFLRYSGGFTHLWMMEATGGKEVQLTDKNISYSGFVRLPYNRQQVRDYSWSPDGTKISYCSRDSGISNVYVLSLSGSETQMISDNTDKGMRFSSPIWSPDNHRLAALISPSSTTASPASADKGWEIWVKEGDHSRIIYKSPTLMRLIGWTPSGDSLIVVSAEKTQSITLPMKVNLFQIPINDTKAEKIADLEAVYFSNIQLSTNGKHIAYVSHAEGRDNVFVIPVAGGQARKVTSNTDPKIYFSSLIWSPDGKNIYYGRQTRRSLVSMFDNFK